MRKEIFLAILAGGAFGLLIAYGAWKLNFSLKRNNNISPSPTPFSQATSIPQVVNGEIKLILSKPQSMEVITETSVEISGVTNPNNLILISGEDDDTIINASDNGNFTGQLNLIGGINQINVTSFDLNGNDASTSFLITYSGQFKKLENTNATSLIGTVTDVTDSIIQLKDGSGGIEQVKPNETASFVNTRNDTTKTIKETDIAIGDFLIAMGTIGNNKIMDATRIVVSDSFVNSIRKAFLGVVTDSSEVGEVSVKNGKSETVKVTLNKLASPDDNDKVVVSGDYRDGIIDARVVKILK